MKCLAAGDALSDRVLSVTADMHPLSGTRNACRERVYAVFNEAGDPSAGQDFSGRRFLGLVDGRQAMLFPNRIFADLVRPWQDGHVQLQTPLEDVQMQLLEGLLYCLPVVDEAGAFLGAVTRDSVLRILADRDRQMLQILKQGIELQEQQHGLIACEIHDGLIQSITAARMHLQSAASRLEAEGISPEAAEPLARGMSLLEDAIAEARRLIRGLNPPILDDLGLVPAIESLVEQQQTTHPSEIEFLYGDTPLHLSRFQQTNLFRIVQEALTNAVRHSGAKQIRIELAQQADQVYLEVRDWGRGFDTHAPCEGYGLQGLRHRTRVLQGKAEITSALGEGTRISVWFPALARAEENAEVL